MKRLIITAAIILLTAAGCNIFQEEINVLKSDLQALQEQVDKMNSDLSSLQILVQAINEHALVESVNPIKENGSWLKFRIS